MEQLIIHILRRKMLNIEPLTPGEPVNQQVIGSGRKLSGLNL